jgi:excinuclease ABC subunit C
MPDLAEQRRQLPDQPGVYLFRDARGRVIYVGKAVSVRKRVASHFRADGRGGALGHDAMVAETAAIEYIVFSGEGEALLAEQAFIKQYRPRFNIRLRDDKSYPFIAISMDEDFPRVYFTRERHRRERAYFGPYSNAKRVRDTLEVLSRVFLVRSCTGAEPGRRSGSPCLDYHIKRCAAPCVGYVSREEYRRGIDGVAEFLRGNYQGIERELEARMKAAATRWRSSRQRSSAIGSPRSARCSSASASRTRPSAHSTRSPSHSPVPTPTPRSFRSATACSPTVSRSTWPMRGSGRTRR